MIRVLQTNFTGGVLSREAQERLDTTAWKNGVGELTNMRVRPQGGADRRPGFAFVQQPLWDYTIAHHIEPFVFGDGQEYVFVFQHGFLDIWHRASRTYVQQILTLWTEPVIRNNELSFVQAYDTMLVFHKDFKPARIFRSPGGSFVLEWLNWSISDDGFSQTIRPPFHKYEVGTSTMWTDFAVNNPIATIPNTMQVYCSIPYFTVAMVGHFIKLRGHQLEIKAITSPTEASCELTTRTGGTAGIVDHSLPAVDWQEEAFSDWRGWPRCGVLHQQRLYLGGGRDVPSVIWGSTTYDPFNFHLGTAQPTDAIKYQAAGDHVAEIRTMVSQTHLQVFTSDAEYFAPVAEGGALTPTTFSLRSQSGFGIANVPTTKLDQSTIFVTKANNALREFVYDGIQTSYTSDALTFMAKDLVKDPIGLDAAMETDFAQESLGIITNADGTLALISKVRKENVGAWMRWDLAPNWVHNIGVVKREIWAIIARFDPAIGNIQIGLCVLDSRHRLDYSRLLSSGVATTAWNCPHLKGSTVTVISGDLDLGEVTIGPTGDFTIPTPCLQIEVGYNFPSRTRPLVQQVQKPDGISWGEPRRIVSTTVSLVDSIGGTVAGTRIPFTNLEGDPGIAPDRQTGKFQAWNLGWGIEEAPVIEQLRPLPFHLRAIGMEVEI